MPTPIDLKVIIKQVLTDPKGLNLPTLPSTAILSGNAVGDKGNWTGVYGHSERSLAIYGESPVFAGFFEGDVYINGHLTSGDTSIEGNLTVTGDLTVKGHSIDELSQKIRQLEQRIDGLEATGVTRNGISVRTPTARPSLQVAFQGRDAGFARFTFAGSGFRRGSPIVFNIFNVTKQRHVDLTSQGLQLGLPNSADLTTSTILTRADGTLDAFGAINCDAGDQVTFTATDGTPDPNDLTGILWSNTASATALD